MLQALNWQIIHLKHQIILKVTSTQNTKHAQIISKLT